MNRWNIALIFLTCFLLGCSPSPQPLHESREPSSTSSADHFIDWGAEDWKFPRTPVAMSYMFEKSHANPTLMVYQQKTRYDGPVEAVDLPGFLAMPDGARRARRKAAHHHLEDAMKFHRVLLRSWEIWSMNRLAAVAQEARTYEFGMITPTLQHLETAAGLDPANAFTWYHLATFRGLAGDRAAQRKALNLCLELSHPEDPDQALLHLRVRLDRAWLNREMGQFEDGTRDVQEAIELMARDEMHTANLAREALLLRALLRVDQGQWDEARALARDWNPWSLPSNAPNHRGALASTVIHKTSLEQIESNFARHWVWALSYLKQGEKELALSMTQKQNWRLEYPPHLNWRFWQDMGRIQEEFGMVDDAHLSYGMAMLNRPFIVYYPAIGARGLSSIFNQPGSGHTYYLGYGGYFLVGSYFSYAANRVAAMEIAPSVSEFQYRSEVALQALGNCLNQGIRPESSRALRGRVHYRLGNFTDAEQDLLEARRLMMAQGQDSADVVKLLAVIRFDAKDFETCLTLLRRYNELEPRDGFGWRLGGLALAHLNRYDEALSQLDVALDIDPQAAPGWYNRALVHLQLGNLDRARVDLEYARRLWPQNAEISKLSTLVSDQPTVPVKMTSRPIELRISREDSLVFAMGDRTSPADLASHLDQDQLDQLLENLRKEYEDSPTENERLALAQTLLRAGQVLETQDLLRPHWPDGLSREEMVLLLRADRARGHARRAVALARSLSHESNPVPDSDFWALIAIICLENDAVESGQLALETALRLDPDNVALLRLKYSPGG